MCSGPYHDRPCRGRCRQFARRRSSNMARTHKTQKKVTVTKKHITCPHCDAELTVTTQREFILMAGRTCPNCDKEFLIVNDLPMSVDQVRERLANKSHAVWRSHENSSWTRR